MIMLCFIGAIFGFAVCIVQLCKGDIVSLGDVLAYIGAPMTGGIVAYMIKSAFEDKRKKENSYEEFENEIFKP